MAADEPRSDNLRGARSAGRSITVPSRPTIDLQEAAAAMARAVRLRATAKSHEYAALMDAPFFGFFVFAHGRWSDLATTFERAYVQEGTFAWRESDSFFPVTSVKTSLRTSLAQFSDIADTTITPQLAAGAELFTLGARLSQVEKQVEQLASAVAGAKGQHFGASKEGSRRVGADPGHAEKPEVKPAVVDTNVIASCVQSFALAKSSTWNLISKQHPGASLFAIDADPRSFQVSEKGEFDGRANLLVSVPRTLRSGRASTHSITIPTRVFGKLSPAGDIEVSDFKIT